MQLFKRVVVFDCLGDPIQNGLEAVKIDGAFVCSYDFRCKNFLPVFFGFVEIFLRIEGFSCDQCIPGRFIEEILYLRVVNFNVWRKYYVQIMRNMDEFRIPVSILR